MAGISIGIVGDEREMKRERERATQITCEGCGRIVSSDDAMISASHGRVVTLCEECFTRPEVA